ncbi:hypothetical protein [Geodermatophilus sp. CPCC 205506]|uniref:hypothetical protein n=1 Tax=Geodermatophilus sp. CPCC 205506 TaxID=2936596 RepID=UPI003EE8A5CA
MRERSRHPEGFARPTDGWVQATRLTCTPATQQLDAGHVVQGAGPQLELLEKWRIGRPAHVGDLIADSVEDQQRRDDPERRGVDDRVLRQPQRVEIGQPRQRPVVGDLCGGDTAAGEGGRLRQGRQIADGVLRETEVEQQQADKGDRCWMPSSRRIGPSAEL